MELQCEYMSCRTFEAKGKRYFIAMFSNAESGPFEIFVNEETYLKLAKLTYLQFCMVQFKLTCRNMRLGLSLIDVVV